MHTNTNSA